MSHNLVFRKGNKVKDFPFQTPTKLTKLVLKFNNHQVQVLILEAYLLGAGYTGEEIEEIIKKYVKAVDSGYELWSN